MEGGRLGFAIGGADVGGGVGHGVGHVVFFVSTDSVGNSVRVPHTLTLSSPVPETTHAEASRKETRRRARQLAPLRRGKSVDAMATNPDTATQHDDDTTSGKRIRMFRQEILEVRRILERINALRHRGGNRGSGRRKGAGSDATHGCEPASSTGILESVFASCEEFEQDGGRRGGLVTS